MNNFRYCNTVKVYDINKQKYYLFVVEKWLSLSEKNGSVDIYEYPVAAEEELNRNRIAMENILFGFKEFHLWISIFIR